MLRALSRYQIPESQCNLSITRAVAREIEAGGDYDSDITSSSAPLTAESAII